MYRLKRNLSAAATDNPLLPYAKDYIRKLPRQTKIVFFLKFIIYTLDTRDTKATVDGLRQLFTLFPELRYNWENANRTYLGNDEGERVYMLFRHAFGNTRRTKK